MRIGEVADAAGLSTKALRYYEQAGLIDEPARTPSGYRDYDAGVLDRLRFIRSAQAAGLTLGEIKGVIAFRERGQPAVRPRPRVNREPRRRSGPAHRRTRPPA
jgi:MerR family copper efflux transcriptional regulator